MTFFQTKELIIDSLRQKCYNHNMQLINTEININTYQEKCNTIGTCNIAIICTPFNIDDISKPFKFHENYSKIINYVCEMIQAVSFKIENGGKLFIYGLPKWLSYYVQFVAEKTEFEFKYWIAVDSDHAIKSGLKHDHIGIVFFAKNGPYKLHTDKVRLPYISCSHCGLNTKDWGGKKHQMNKLGSGISDVWRDIYKTEELVEDTFVPGLKLHKLSDEKKFNIIDNKIPDFLIERIINLAASDNETIQIIRCTDIINETDYIEKKELIIGDSFKEKNTLFLGDCIAMMDNWIAQYPNGCFDLIFADPPYNLDKSYINYNDQNNDDSYLEWCNQWISRCAKLLRPNGSLFILNLPKWALRHTEILNTELYLQNWIVWDALSTPKGKIMPAHYALLYYTKSYKPYIINEKYLETNEKIHNCSRIKCKAERLNTPLIVGDMWSDIHRIKHKVDRDEHPCQLPKKLMERIIGSFSNENETIFDPFSGAGTTAIVAKQMKRNYVGIDISEKYNDIALRKIKDIEQYGEIKKISTKAIKNKVPKKMIEKILQELSYILGKKPTENEVEEFLKNKNYGFQVEDIIKVYGDFNLAVKCTRLILKGMVED